MLIAQNDQFTQALFGKLESVLIVCAILIVVVGIPLYWLRLKAERGLIRVIRSARERRQAQKSAADTDSSERGSALSRLQRVDGKEACAPRCECGFELLGLQQLSEVPRHARDLIIWPRDGALSARVRRQKETGCLIRAAGYAFR
jgi:hypothetical protein